MINLIGCSKDNFFKLIDQMNYIRDNNSVDVYSYRGYRKEKKKVKFSKKRDNPFQKLMTLNLKWLQIF